MAFTSLDDMIAEMAAGKYNRYDWNKITNASALVAGRWYDFSGFNGTPVANAWAGTALAWRSCDESTGNGTQIFGIRHGGDVSVDTKHILNVMAVTAVATGVPGVLQLVDLQGYYPGISCNTASAQTLTGTPTLRYTNGEGCRLYPVLTSANGATAQNLALSYTDTSGTAGNTLPVTVSMTASSIVQHIPTSGLAANNYGPFLPLASGDTGVQSVQTVTMSIANTGTFALCLARPLLSLPITTATVAAERDLVNQLPSLPRVYDGACLTWLFFPGAATAASTNYYGSVETAWG